MQFWFWKMQLFSIKYIISLGTTPSRSIHIATNAKISFLWLSSSPFYLSLSFSLPVSLSLTIYIYIYAHTHRQTDRHTHHLPFVHTSVDGHLDCFHILAIVNNAMVNIGVLVSFQIDVFIFFGYALSFGFSFSCPMSSLLTRSFVLFLFSTV